MPRRPRTPLRSLAAVALALAALGVAACGSEDDSKEVVEGQPVTLGELEYNVIFSRFLNASDNEDSAYLEGQPEAPSGASYFGVFLEVQNEDEAPHRLPGKLKIVDAEGAVFETLESDSLYALPFGGEVESQEQIPILDSTAQQGAIKGSLALFLLPDFVAENRPLILEIPGPEGPAEVTLDL